MSTAEPGSSAPLGQFDIAKYRPDGGVSLAGALQLTGILGLLGILLGIVASFISRYFWLVLVFPIIIGCCIGAVGSACIKRFHIRNSIYCGISGLLAGALAMLAMHYFDYRYFQDEMRANLGPDADIVFELARNIDEITAPNSDAPQEIRDCAENLKLDPFWLKALQVNSLLDYLDLQAEIGVEIGDVVGAGQRNANLGYVGSYIYWIIEAALVAGFAFGIMSGSASQPYCQNCSQWKPPLMVGMYPDPDHVCSALKEGCPARWIPTELATEPLAKVTLSPCSMCQDNAPIQVFVEKVTRNKKGEVATKRVARLTYPAGSLHSLAIALGIQQTAADATDVEDDVVQLDEVEEA